METFAQPPATPIKAIVYGSCVARDTVEALGDDGATLGYAARQGFISAVSGDAALDGSIQLDSDFQRNSVEMDVQGTAMSQVQSSARKSNVLILDLVDERLGVYRAPNGAYVTRTWELVNSGIIEQQEDSMQLIDFGTEEHFHLWHSAAEIIIAELSRLGLPTVVLAPPFAERDLEGEALTYLDRPIGEWNTTFDRYYDAIGRLGVPVLRPPAELAIADRNHRWGLAPFHYAAPMYEWFCTTLRGAVALAERTER